MNLNFLLCGRNNQIQPIEVSIQQLSYVNRIKIRLEKFHFNRALENWRRVSESASDDRESFESDVDVLRIKYAERESHLEMIKSQSDIYNYTVFKIFIKTISVANQIPASVYHFTNLKEIYALRLKELSENIGNLRNLSKLIVNFSRLSQLPNSICTLSLLHTLIIRMAEVEHRIADLPNEIGNLQELQKLEITTGNIKLLPQSFGNLSKLTYLDLSNNKLENISQVSELVNLTFLDLSRNQIKSLPDSVSQMSKLETVILSDNLLSSIPSFTNSKNSLKSVQFRYNILFNVDWIWGCPLLETIDISNNNISSIPEDIQNLHGLKTFKCKNNLLENIPNAISNLQNLLVLDLDYNRLTHLPAMNNLISLRCLYLDSNPLLDSLPMGLMNSQFLTSLTAYGTRIPIEQVEAIRRTTYIRRHETNDYKQLLHFWIICSEEHHNFDFVETTFNKEQKENITEWLIRLQNSADFFKIRNKLSKLVCQMIETLRNSKEFRDDFFSKMEGNLDCCGDRAAMLLNLLYTDWVLCTLDKKED